MITEDILLAAGYKRYKDSFSNADWLYQKRIEDDYGKPLYFINLFYYKFLDRDAWELSMSFQREHKLFDYCHLKLGVKEYCTVADVEDIALHLFDVNDGICYE